MNDDGEKTPNWSKSQLLLLRRLLLYPYNTGKSEPPTQLGTILQQQQQQRCMHASIDRSIDGRGAAQSIIISVEALAKRPIWHVVLAGSIIYFGSSHKDANIHFEQPLQQQQYPTQPTSLWNMLSRLGYVFARCGYSRNDIHKNNNSNSSNNNETARRVTERFAQAGV